jgi:hypothetical protein
VSNRHPPIAAPPERLRRSGYLRTSQSPFEVSGAKPGAPRLGALDRRGESWQIFTTIFVRPALELRPPIRHLAASCVVAARNLASDLAETSLRMTSGRVRQH